MDEVDTLAGPQLDENAYQACYIFNSKTATGLESEQRPNKKRKVSVTPLKSDTTWPKLLGGAESEDSALMRQSLYEEIWSEQQHYIENVSSWVDQALLNEISSYVLSSDTSHKNEKIRTGLILSRSASNAQKHLVQRWKEKAITISNEVVVQLFANQATSLQGVLKSLIKTVIESHAGAEEYTNFLNSRKRLIPMNFDLELLQRYVEQQKITNVVISIPDVESFDTRLIFELFASLCSWNDRIPFSLLLGIATTVDLFESRLSRSTIKLLEAQVFEISSQQDPLHELFDSIQNNTKTRLFLGSSTITSLLEMSQDQHSSTDSLSRAFKYIYMSHFFANPLALLLQGKGLISSGSTTGLCEAIRNTDSFREYCEGLLKTGKAAVTRINELLNNDKSLLKIAIEAVELGTESMRNNQKSMQIFKTFHSHLNISDTPYLEFEIRLLSNLDDFVESDIYENLYEQLEMLDSGKLLALLNSISTAFPDFDFDKDQKSSQSMRSVISTIETIHRNSGKPTIRSPHENKIPTPKSKSKSTQKGFKAEEEYSNILNKFLETFQTYFQTNIISPTSLLLHEAFLYDLRAPLNTSFGPRPRFAIERALVSPSDYLSCDCCAPFNGQSNPTRHPYLPPTSIVHSMLIEAGAVTNVYDLWTAFKGVLIPESLAVENGTVLNHDESDRENPEVAKERQALALFYRSLSELKMLGMVKSSKKKPGVECIASTMWAGL